MSYACPQCQQEIPLKALHRSDRTAVCPHCQAIGEVGAGQRRERKAPVGIRWTIFKNQHRMVAWCYQALSLKLWIIAGLLPCAFFMGSFAEVPKLYFWIGILEILTVFSAVYLLLKRTHLTLLERSLQISTFAFTPHTFLHFTYDQLRGVYASTRTESGSDYAQLLLGKYTLRARLVDGSSTTLISGLPFRSQALYLAQELNRMLQLDLAQAVLPGKSLAEAEATPGQVICPKCQSKLENPQGYFRQLSVPCLECDLLIESRLRAAFPQLASLELDLPSKLSAQWRTEGRQRVLERRWPIRSGVGTALVALFPLGFGFVFCSGVFVEIFDPEVLWLAVPILGVGIAMLGFTGMCFINKTFVSMSADTISKEVRPLTLWKQQRYTLRECREFVMRRVVYKSYGTTEISYIVLLLLHDGRLVSIMHSLPNFAEATYICRELNRAIGK